MSEPNNIFDKIKSGFTNIFNKLINKKNDKKINLESKTYLEYKINKFFKKEKLFKTYWLDLYYNFNKKFSKIISTPFYIKMFYANFNYVNSCVINAEWDQIMELYKKVVKKHPNYKNSRLDDPKPIYDRRYILLITYHIFIIFVYAFAAFLYSKMSKIFNKIIINLNIERL